jgi:hypothetical protein
MISTFPLIKRFQDIQKSPNFVILSEDITVYDISFKTGSVFQILGWREINEKSYLVLVKGTWEGLIDFEFISDKLKTLK